jgi:hypothetical protein
MESVSKPVFKKVKLSHLAQSREVSIPDDWLVKSLNEIAEINPEVIDEDYPHKEILYVDIGSVESFRIQKYERVDLVQRPSRAQRIIKKNDIINCNNMRRCMSAKE